MQTRRIHPLVALGFVALLVIGGLYWLVRTGPVIEGQDGRIDAHGAPVVIVARDRAVFDGLTGRPAADLLNDPNVLMVPDRTLVRVLSIDGTRSRVQIMDGQFAGQEVWAHVSMIVRP